MTYSIPDLDYMRDRIATVNAIKLYNQPKLIDMEREQQKGRVITVHNAVMDHTEKDCAAERFRKLREQMAITNLERFRMQEKREQYLAKVGFLMSLLPYALGATVLIGLLYGLWAHNVTFEQVFTNGGLRP